MNSVCFQVQLLCVRDNVSPKQPMSPASAAITIDFFQRFYSFWKSRGVSKPSRREREKHMTESRPFCVFSPAVCVCVFVSDGDRRDGALQRGLKIIY